MSNNHNHSLFDSDSHFLIDPKTREIVCDGKDPLLLVLGDHNSEIYTFDIPRYIDGHDMSLCDKVRIHFANIGSPRPQINNGIYEVDEIVVTKDYDDLCTFTWKISGEATKYVGTLNFAIDFLCFDGDEIVYSWNTTIFKNVLVVETLDNVGDFVSKNEDLLEKWKQDLEAAVPKVSIERTENGCVISVNGTESALYDGKNGVGISNIIEYYQTSKSSDEIPTEWLTNAPVMTPERKYLWSYTKITYTNNISKETEKRIIGIYGDTGLPGEDVDYTQVQDMIDKSEESLTEKIQDKAVEAAIIASRSDLASAYEDAYTYGFVEHMDVLSPANRIEYIGINRSFSPVQMDLDTHVTNYGSWSKFPSLVENKPYMVKSNGVEDYQLKEDDYRVKMDGTPSDVENIEYSGGAFSKFIKVYVKRKNIGTDRYVRFSYIPIDGYEACGFIDTDGKELSHVWIPMFYGSTVDGKMRSLSGLQPDINQNTASQYTNIMNFSERAAFFGGPIIETIRDMLYMLFKTTDIQSACGRGNCSGQDSNSSPYYGVLPNAVIDGGQFYGTSNGKQLNKLFHSIVLGSYQQWQRDPYYLCVKGRFKVSTDYTYDVSGAKYIDTGIDVETISSDKWLYPNLCENIDGFGSIPISPHGGSTTTGYCDGVYHTSRASTFTAVVRRFGACRNGTYAGPSCLYLYDAASDASWSVSASVLLRPPVTA